MKKEISYYKASDAKSFKNLKKDIEVLLDKVRKRENALAKYFYSKFDEPLKFTRGAWKNDIIYIAIGDGGLVAFAWAKIVKLSVIGSKKSQKVGELVSSIFNPTFANEHVLKTAINLVSKELKKKGCKYFLAPTFEPSKGEQAFYKSLGMKIEGIQYWKKL